MLTSEARSVLRRISDYHARLSEAVAELASLPQAESTEVREVQLPNNVVSWRERLWAAPHETRLSAMELSEALGKSVSWVHKRTSARSGHVQIPHRRLNDGKLSFLAGEVRKWLIASESNSNPSRVLPLTSTRNGRRELRQRR